MSKLKLEIEYDYDFTLFGICCHEKDYRLTWAINSKLHYQLQRKEDVEVKDKKRKEPTLYPFYLHEDIANYREYILVGNKSDRGYLIPKQKKVDYFLIIKGAITSTEKDRVLRALKEIAIVLTAYEINAKLLESKQNLLF